MLRAVSNGSGGVIDSPTFTGLAKGAPTVLTVGGIPLIGLSSGSVAAGGGISGITALPVAYPDAYCYFPASKLATSGPGSTAGFYYCQFSTTTAGTAFLNSYTSGTPTIPASPTAVTNGQGAFTGDTTEEFGVTITIPALTTKSAISVGVSGACTNNANAKTVNVRLSGNSGTIFLTQALANLAGAGFVGLISNTGLQNKQVSSALAAFAVNVGNQGTLGTVDLSTGTATLVFSIQRGTATDNLILLPPTVEALAL